MSQNHPAAIASSNSSELEFMDQFESIGGGRELQIVLRALEVPNHRAVAPVAHSILWLLKEAPWLADELRSRLEFEKLAEALRSITADGPADMPLTRGSTPEFWATLALTNVHESRLGGLPPLAAILLIGLVDSFKGARDVPPRRAFEDLARTIRAMCEFGPRHPYRRAVSEIRDSSDSSAYATALNRALDTLYLDQGPRGDFHRAWSDQITPWLVGQTRNSLRPPVAVPPSAPTTQPTRKPHRAGGTQAAQHAHCSTHALEPTHSISAPEPADEAAATVGYISPAASSSARRHFSPDLERSFAWQRIRSENHYLHPGHVSCLTAAEQQVIVPGVKTRWERALSEADCRTSALCATYLLTTVTGLTPDRVLLLPIFRQGTALNVAVAYGIDLSQGVLRLRALRPEEAFDPQGKGTALSELLEVTVDHIELPLAPTLVSLLQRHSSQWPCRTLGERAASNGIDGAISKMLSTACSLPARSRSPSRAGRRFASAIFEYVRDVATTQLIAGDTLGFSTAPLFYYAADITALQSVYRSVTWPWLGDDAESSVDHPASARIGSRGLVRLCHLQQGVRQVYKALDFNAASHAESTATQLIAEHNGLINATLFHLSLIGLVRPTDATFELGRNDFDVEDLLSIVSDKAVDAAHIFRVIFLSSALARQVDALLAHLEVLRDDARLPAGFRDYAAKAVEGQGPLFRFADSSGGTLRGDVATWRTFWPKAWGPLSDDLINFFRHAGATYLRELGLPGWIVSFQLGHLEAAGWPLSSSSAIRVVEVACEFALHAARYEKILGLRCRLGRGNGKPTRAITALRTWQQEISDAAKRCRDAEERRRLQIRCSQEDVREKARAVVSEVLSCRFPNLQALIGCAEAGAERPPGIDVEFRHEDALELTALLRDLEQPLPVRVAAHNFACNQIRNVAKRYRINFADIGTIHAAPQPEPTPVFVAMLSAREQVRTLRERLAPANGRGALSVLTRSTLALTCVARVVDVKQLLATLRNARRARLLSGPGLHLLVPGDPDAFSGPTADPLSGVSGLAAVAVAGIANSAEELEHIDETSISLALFKDLPEFFAGVSPNDALDHLLRTVSVARILDLPGIVRHAVSDRGSVPAAAGHQLAWMSGALPFPVPIEDAPLSEDSGSNDIRETEERPSSPIGPATLRRRISAALSLSVESAPTPAKGEKKGTLEITLPIMRERLVSLSKLYPKDAPTIGRAIIDWSIHLIDHGTPQRRHPAPSTVSTYVTAIHAKLLEVFDGEDLRSIDAEDYSARYLAIVEARDDESACSRVAAQTIHFHRFLERSLGLEKADLSDLSVFTVIADRQVTADACTEPEYRRARAWIESGNARPSYARLRGCRSRRRWRIAQHVLALLHSTGMRLREASLLTHSDVAICGDRIVVFVRRSYYRRLKTPSARRVLDLSQYMDATDLESFRRWIDGEKLRLASNASPKSLLFPSIEDARAGTSAATIRSLIQSAFAGAGCRPLWPHLLRHGWVHRQIVKAWSPDVRDATGWSTHRRMQMISIHVGHARPSITASCYFHCPWLLLAAAADGGGDDDRQYLASMSGMALRTVDQLKRRPPRAAVMERMGAASATWSGRVLARSSEFLRSVEPRLSSTTFPDQSSDELRLEDLDVIFRHASTNADFENLGWSFGASDDDLASLDQAVTDLARCTSVRLLPRATRLDNQVRTTPPRRLSGGQTVSTLKQLGDAAATELRLLVDAFASVVHAAGVQRENCFNGSPESVRAFADRLTSVCGLSLTLEPQERRGTQNCFGALPNEPTGGPNGFDLLIWNLGLAFVADRVRRPLPEEKLQRA